MPGDAAKPVGVLVVNRANDAVVAPGAEFGRGNILNGLNGFNGR